MLCYSPIPALSPWVPNIFTTCVQNTELRGVNLQAAFDEASAKNGLSKILEGLLGNISMEELESAATEAEFKARSTSVVAREAALADRCAAVLPGQLSTWLVS